MLKLIKWLLIGLIVAIGIYSYLHWDSILEKRKHYENNVQRYYRGNR